MRRRFSTWAPIAAFALALAPAVAWTAATLTRPGLRANALIALAALAVGLRGARRLGPLSARPWPLTVALSGLLGFLFLERTVDISLLSAACALVALYGLFGLYASPGRWRRSRAGWLFALAALPIAEQAHHYAGFALRVATAKLVAGQLGALGARPVTAETILVLERGVAHVEAACSGLGSVWAGSLCLLGVAFAARAPVGARWLVALGLQSGLLFLGNVLRITALVLLVHHYEAPKLAELVHQPLGVIAFAVAALVGAGALLAGRRRRRRPRRVPRLPIRGPALAIALTVAGALAALAHTRRPLPEATNGRLSFTFDAALSARPLPLDAGERDLFDRWGAPDASKHALRQRGRRAALVLVPSADWRAHHPPALCLTGSGHRLEAPAPARIGPARVTHSLADGGARTAVYWFQSPDRTTSALLERIEDGVLGAKAPWVLVTLLVDGGLSPDDPELEALVTHVHRAVGDALAGRSVEPPSARAQASSPRGAAARPRPDPSPEAPPAPRPRPEEDPS